MHRHRRRIVWIAVPGLIGVLGIIVSTIQPSEPPAKSGRSSLRKQTAALIFGVTVNRGGQFAIAAKPQ